MNRFAALAGLALVASAGCHDDDRTSITAPPPPPRAGALAYVGVSEMTPPTGSTVTVLARVRTGADVKAAASFTARLAYDVAGLTFVDEVKLAKGMRAINATQPGLIIAAGAAPEGLEDGILFAVTFRVNDPAALKSLDLTVQELSGTDFSNELSKLAKHGAIVRDRLADHNRSTADR